MITIQNGKLTIPEEQRFIGFAGDNLKSKIEFLVVDATESDRIYRIYLTFDDGTVNCFTLSHTITSQGILLTWDVLEEHIFKSGIVRAQLKAFSQNNVIWHSTPDIFVVGNSAEFSDFLTKPNSEFLDYERKLNSLKEYIEGASLLLVPYIGDNGNWYIYNNETGGYVDSGKPSVGEADTQSLADGAVTSEKIAAGAIDTTDKFSAEMLYSHFSLPVIKKAYSTDFTESEYNTYTTPGIYQIDAMTGIHEVVAVFAPDSDSYLMQVNMKYNSIRYRGIWCSTEGVYADEDWEEWTELCFDSNPLFIGGFNTFADLQTYNFIENKLYMFYTSGGLQASIGSGKCIGTVNFVSGGSDESTQMELSLFNYTTGRGYNVNLTSGEITKTTADTFSVDAELSASSENPVQNKVVTEAIESINTTLEGLESMLASV